MSRTTAWLVHVSVILVGVTGLVYGWMRYFAEPADEFAVVNHPWQPDLQAWHILAAPLLVFGCGLLWRAHVWARIANGFKVRRTTGITLAVLLLPMVVSGYLIQVTAEEWWRTLWIWVHGVGSSLWLLVYIVHQLRRRPRR